MRVWVEVTYMCNMVCVHVQYNVLVMRMFYSRPYLNERHDSLLSSQVYRVNLMHPSKCQHSQWNVRRHAHHARFIMRTAVNWDQGREIWLLLNYTLVSAHLQACASSLWSWLLFNSTLYFKLKGLCVFINLSSFVGLNCFTSAFCVPFPVSHVTFHVPLHQHC